MRNPVNPIQSQTSVSSCSLHFSLSAVHRVHEQFLPFKHEKLTFRVLCSSQTPQNISNQGLSFISILRAIPDWADRIKERGMRRKRTLYDHDKWVEHRSSLRHIRHLLSSLSSRVILSLVPPVIVFTSVAVVIASYNSAVSLDWLPEFFPVLRASSLPYQLTAPALALLLVFRTEASYSRYEEGRRAWTKILAGTSDFSRQVIATSTSGGDSLLKRKLLNYIMAFPVTLKVCDHLYLLSSIIVVTLLSLLKLTVQSCNVVSFNSWLGHCGRSPRFA